MVKLTNRLFATYSLDKTLKLWDFKHKICKKTFKYIQDNQLANLNYNSFVLTDGKELTICYTNN